MKDPYVWRGYAVTDRDGELITDHGCPILFDSAHDADGLRKHMSRSQVVYVRVTVDEVPGSVF